MTDGVFIAIIVAMTIVIVIAALILLRRLKPKNRREADVSGGVNLNDPLLSITGTMSGKKHFHTGTLVVGNTVDRIKINIYNCANNNDRIMYINSTLKIGRHPEEFPHDPAAYRVENDSMVSGVHCILINYAGSLAVMDNNSTNHTYLNGNMISGTVYVNDGDHLRIGNTELVIRILV